MIQCPYHHYKQMFATNNDKEISNTTNHECPRKSILQRSPKEDEEILSQTLDWLQGSVIGLNLCPFAEKPFQQKKMNIEVLQGSDQVEILSLVLGECLKRKDEPGTSLMVCPELFPSNFRAFLEVYNMLENGVLLDNDLDGYIQVAPFHPLFEFEGSSPQAIDNYTNRSPYPIFHVLREVEVDTAVKALDGDASKVWKRNVELLETLEAKLGREKTEQVLLTGKEEEEDDNDGNNTTSDKIAKILQWFKKGRGTDIDI